MGIPFPVISRSFFNDRKKKGIKKKGKKEGRKKGGMFIEGQVSDHQYARLAKERN